MKNIFFNRLKIRATLKSVANALFVVFAYSLYASLLLFVLTGLIGIADNIGKWVTNLKDQNKYEITVGSNLVFVENSSGKKWLAYNSNPEKPIIYEIDTALNYCDWVDYESDSLYAFSYKGKWGFISDHTGKIIIPPVYHEVEVFNEGLCAVNNEKGLKGLINSNGDTVVPFGRYAEFSYFFDEYAVVSNSEKQGLINKLGVEVIPLLYDDITRWALSISNEAPIEHSEVYCSDYFLVSTNSKVGLYNKNSILVLDTIYDVILVTDDLQWFASCLNDLMGIYDKNFNLYIPHKYDHIIYDDNYFSLVKDESYSLFSISERRMITNTIYKDISPFYYKHNFELDTNICEEYYIVESAKWKKGLISTKNYVKVVQPAYQSIQAISNQLFECELDYGLNPNRLVSGRGIIATSPEIKN